MTRPEAHKPATLVSGVVELSLRGNGSDVEWLLDVMRAAGATPWQANSIGTKDGNRAGYSYYSVEVPRDTDG